MTQADGTHSLKRMRLSYNGINYDFRVNPENYEKTIPQRVSVTRTQSATVVEDFNNDVAVITISGTTGNDKNQTAINGMKNFLDGFNRKNPRYGQTPKPYMIFYNFTDGEYNYVTMHSDGVTYTRDVNNPLVSQYKISFYVIGNLSDADIDSTITNAETTTSDSNKGSGNTTFRSSGYSSGTVSSNSQAGTNRASSIIGAR